MPSAQVAAIALLAGLARLPLLALQPLWRDEAFTAVVVRRPWGEMLAVVRNDSAPPLGYIVTKAVSYVSTSPFVLRLPSTLMAIAWVPLAAWLGRRIGGDRAGLTAAALAAVLPYYALASVDLRMYAPAITFSLAATVALWRAIERPDLARVSLYAALVALAVYSVYFNLIAVAAQLAAALIILRPSVRTAARVIVGATVGVLTLVPWVLVASQQFKHASAPFWVPSLSPLTFVVFFGQLLGGPFSDTTTLTTRLILGALVAIAGLVIGIGLLRVYRGAGDRAAVGFISLAAGIGLLVMLVISLRRSFFDARYGAPTLAPAIALAGAGLALVGRQAMAWSAVGLLAITATVFALNRSPDVPDLIAPIQASVQANDLVAITDKHLYFPVAYYGGDHLLSRTRVVSTDIQWFDGSAAFPPGLVVPTIPEVAGKLFVVDARGDAQPALPYGFARRAYRCIDQVCLGTYTR